MIFEEMFRRLGAKYGESRKLVDAVIWDLKKIKPIPEGDNRNFVNMVDTVERGQLELRKLGLDKEMNTTSIVTMIERLLPKTQKTRMDYQNGSQAKFRSTERLYHRSTTVIFTAGKRVIEYIHNDVRGYITSSAKQINHVTIRTNERTTATDR